MLYLDREVLKCLSWLQLKSTRAFRLLQGKVNILEVVLCQPYNSPFLCSIEDRVREEEGKWTDYWKAYTRKTHLGSISATVRDRLLVRKFYPQLLYTFSLCLWCGQICQIFCFQINQICKDVFVATSFGKIAPKYECKIHDVTFAAETKQLLLNLCVLFGFVGEINSWY